MRRLHAWLPAFALAAGFPCNPLFSQPSPNRREPVREGLRPDQRPALSISALQISPDSPGPGEVVRITARIANRSSTAVSQVSVVTLINAQQLRSEIINVPAMGQTIAVTEWKPERPGDYSVRMTVDPLLHTTDLDRGDNTVAQDVAVSDAPPAAADTSVVRTQLLEEPGKPRSIRVIVRNRGRVAATTPVRILVNGEVLTTRLLGPIPAQADRVIDIPFNSLEPVRSLEAWTGKVRPPGEFRTPQRGGVDLTPAELSLHASTLQPGNRRAVTVTFQIQNLGGGAVSTPFRTRIDPGVITSAGPQPFFVDTPAMPAEGPVYVSHTIENAPAAFDVFVHVDPAGALTETNKHNNRAALHFKNPVPDMDRWVSIGPRRITGISAHGYGWNDSVGRLASIAIDPGNPNIMYVGAKASGVWKTTTGGAAWMPLTDGIDVSVAALAVDPTANNRLFWATGTSGFYVSLDRGVSWVKANAQNLSVPVHGGILKVHPTNSGTLYITSDHGVYRSKDAGVTWSLVLNKGPATGLTMDPANPSHLYAAIYHQTDNDAAGAYFSGNGGDGWQKMTGCPGGRLPANTAGVRINLAQSPGRLYASFRPADSFVVYRTTDISCSIGGRMEHMWEAAWSTNKVHSILWGGMWSDPTDKNFVYLGGTDFWRSTDGGTSFEDVAPLGNPPGGAHSDHHGFAVRPGAPATIYTLNDGGIYRSAHHGQKNTWEFLGDGIANVEFYDTALAPSNSLLTIGGTQDNGTIRYDSQNMVWKEIMGGDGATVAIHPTDSNTLFAMYQYADSVVRSTDGGASWASISSGLPKGAVCFNFSFFIHPAKPHILLGPCGTELWRITFPSTAWTSILSDSTGVAIATVDPATDLYYAGLGAGRLFAAVSGAGWKSVFSHPSGANFADIEIDPEDPATIYTAHGGYGAGRVFRLKRNAFPLTVLTSFDITSDLPHGLAASKLAVDRMNPFTVYIGTNKGVWRGRSSDQGETWVWTSYNNGMPMVPIHDMEVHPSTGILLATTHGRSAFQANTGPPIGSLLSATGKLISLRVHDVGTGYGPPHDFLDTEAVFKLDSEPRYAFGFPLKQDAKAKEHRAMLRNATRAFERNDSVSVDFIRRGLHAAEVVRFIRNR